MAAGGTAVICQVLAGTGGVGKTQLAAHYARRMWGADMVDLLDWVTGREPGGDSNRLCPGRSRSDGR